MLDNVLSWLALWFAADQDPKPPSFSWDVFAQYGVLGVAVMGLGWIVFRILNQLLTRSADELAREVARGDRLEAENRTLNLAMQDKAIPALLASANTLTECTALLRELQRELAYALRRRDGDGR